MSISQNSVAPYSCHNCDFVWTPAKEAEPCPECHLTPKQAELFEILCAPQRHTLFYGGARSGKTFLIVYAIMLRALIADETRHAMFRLRGNHARSSLWLETIPRVAKVFWPQLKLIDHTRDGYIELPNGSEIWIAGADDKERVEKILGKEFSTLYFNECSQIPYSSVLMILTRLAQVHPQIQQRAIYDLNPVGTRHYTSQIFIAKRDPLTQRALIDPEEYRYAFINPRDNSANLSGAFLKSLETMPERQRKRFFEGVFQAEIDGALWTLEKLARARCEPSDVPRDLRRCVVAIDPSGTAGDEDTRSDNVGIVVVAKGLDDQSYVLADRTCNLAPEGWARIAVNAYHEFSADCIVAEANFGGDMVRALLHTVDPKITVRLVKASRGKAVRAEPISALYGHEKDGMWLKDQVRHAGEFLQLEDQLLNFSTSGYQGDRSPDRADALVWALTDLYIEQGKDQGYIEWLREAASEVEARKAPAQPPKEPNYAIGSMQWEEKQRLRREKDRARARAEDEALERARRGG